MDEFDFDDDDDSFEESLAQVAVQVESQSRRSAPAQAAQNAIELDDTFDDDESASQALLRAGQQPVTPSPPRIVDLTDNADEDFEMSDVNEDDLLAVFEESNKRANVGRRACVDFGKVNWQRPAVLEFKTWTHIPLFGEDDYGDPNYEDPDNIATLRLVETHAISHIVGPVQQPVEGVIQLTRAELEAIKQNAFTAGHMSQHRQWKRRYVYDFLLLPAGMSPPSTPSEFINSS